MERKKYKQTHSIRLSYNKNEREGSILRGIRRIYIAKCYNYHTQKICLSLYPNFSLMPGDHLASARQLPTTGDLSLCSTNGRGRATRRNRILRSIRKWSLWNLPKLPTRNRHHRLHTNGARKSDRSYLEILVVKLKLQRQVGINRSRLPYAILIESRPLYLVNHRLAALNRLQEESKYKMCRENHWQPDKGIPLFEGAHTFPNYKTNVIKSIRYIFRRKDFFYFIQERSLIQRNGTGRTTETKGTTQNRLLWEVGNARRAEKWPRFFRFELNIAIIVNKNV